MNGCDQKVLDRPLWCVRLGEAGLCAAETPEGVFVVLFTSRALAGRFIREEGLATSERASTRLYSSTRAQFLARAAAAAADGLRGTLVDLQADGIVSEILRFQPPERTTLATPGRQLGQGRTIH